MNTVRARTPYEIGDADVLLVVDMQNDFMPGGALPVGGGDEVVDGISQLAERFRHVVLTADAHPSNHVSFAITHPSKRAIKDTSLGAYGTQPFWPEHCVQGTDGARITPHLRVPHRELVLRKGIWRETENISAFFDGDGRTPTGLDAYLRQRNVSRTFLCGLALDVCVGWSAVDSARLGFETFVIEDLTRSTGIPELLPQVSRRFADQGVRMCAAGSLRAATTRVRP